MQQLSKPSLQKRAKPKARAFVHVWRLKDGFAWFVAGDDVGGHPSRESAQVRSPPKASSNAA
jgi:hypothetical protein